MTQFIVMAGALPAWFISAEPNTRYCFSALNIGLESLFSLPPSCFNSGFQRRVNFFKLFIRVIKEFFPGRPLCDILILIFLVNETASSADLLLSEWPSHGMCQTCKILK